MAYRRTQERGRWPFLTPRLENVTDKTRENAPPLVKQIWEFLEEQLEVAEKREMTVGIFVTAANEVTIGGFWSPENYSYKSAAGLKTLLVEYLLMQNRHLTGEERSEGGDWRNTSPNRLGLVREI